MASARLIHIVIATAALVWAGMLLAEGTPLHWEFLRPYELVAASVVFAVNVYDWWLWRKWPIVYISPVPLIRGTWQGELRSSWVDPQTGQAVPPVKVYLAVRQTAGSLNIRLFTPSSASASTTASVSNDAGVGLLTTTYRNIPDLLQRATSPIHNGTMLLEVPERFPKRLKGSYWTDRSSQGEIAFDRRSPKVAADLLGARGLKFDHGVVVSRPTWLGGTSRAKPAR